MHKTAQTFWKLAFASVVTLVLTALTPHAKADDYLATFQVGTTVYSNVTVMTKTSTDIFFKHSKGFGNAKVPDVDRSTLAVLGYQVPKEEREVSSVISESAQSVLESSAVTNLVADPRIQQAQALLAGELSEFVGKLTPQVLQGITAAIITLYLFFCFCCRLICVKTGQKASPLIWLPILKQIPLLRAAGISRWWAVPMILFFPVAWPLVKIWWSFKIAPARGKSWAVGLFLILPITNIFAFLYLAFSGTGPRSTGGNSNVISLGPPARRAA